MFYYFNCLVNSDGIHNVSNICGNNVDSLLYGVLDDEDGVLEFCTNKELISVRKQLGGKNFKEIPNILMDNGKVCNLTSTIAIDGKVIVNNLRHLTKSVGSTKSIHYNCMNALVKVSNANINIDYRKYPAFNVLCFFNTLLVNSRDLDDYTLECFVDAMQTGTTYYNRDLGSSGSDYLRELVNEYNKVRNILKPAELKEVWYGGTSQWASIYETMLSFSNRTNYKASDNDILSLLARLNLPKQLLNIAKDKLFMIV